MFIIHLIWCLPQFLLGLILYLYFMITKKYHDKIHLPKRDCLCVFFKSNKIASFSLGYFIFINQKYNNIYTIPHECGHAKQSLCLGWLYLPVIGLTSMLLNIFARRNRAIRENYYNCFPENWADYLGKVHRDNNKEKK
jgi:hypothetical protein